MSRHPDKKCTRQTHSEDGLSLRWHMQGLWISDSVVLNMGEP
jgi:hypothetical protein